MGQIFDRLETLIKSSLQNLESLNSDETFDTLDEDLKSAWYNIIKDHREYEYTADTTDV